MTDFKFNKLKELFSVSNKSVKYLIFIGLFLIAGLTVVIILAQNKSIQSDNPADDIKRIWARCNNATSDWNRCYSEELSRYTKTNSINRSVVLLENLQVKDSRTLDCHLIAHKIASAEITKDPRNWKKIFIHVNQDACMGGYTHGVVEGIRSTGQLFELNSQTISDFCTSINNETQKTDTDACAHAMGHILLVEMEGNLLGGTRVCNELTGKMRDSCNNGLFMENITRDNLSEHGIEQKRVFNEEQAENIENECRRYSLNSATACWRELSHLYAFLAGYKPEKIHKYCSRAPIAGDRDECYIHSFNSIMVNTDFSDQDISFLCSPYLNSDDLLQRCLNWAMHTLIFNSSGLTDRAINICSRMPQNFQAGCFRNLGIELSQKLSRDERQDICKKIPPQFQNDCNCTSCTEPDSAVKHYLLTD